MSIITALLFTVFGIQSLLAKDEGEDQGNEKLKYSSVFWSAFSLIFIAELGDKTQLAVAGLATTHTAWSVWLGASLALVATTLLAVALGKILLKRVSSVWLHKIGGALFLIFAVITCWQAFAH
jgi:putative Ca2+/H+ antiporter (TMEM165/GDT1 family)